MRLTKVVLASCLLSGVAAADNDGVTISADATATSAPAPAVATAEPAKDPAPPAPTPTIPGVTGNVVEQAGVGGTAGYGTVGVVELGGSAGLTMAQDIRMLNFSPSVGWFLVDNFELSGILDVANIKAGAGTSATIWSALVEPSFHIPVNNNLFGFIGMGVGASYVSELGAGMTVAPRIGMDVLVGRSGVLRPSLSYQYTTHDAMAATNGTADVTLVAISSALRFNIGYSSMW